MDQGKIGRFIADCRKQKGLTQAQLAEQLHITDRAVSKWETGKSLPDSSIMLTLCDVLEISVNDLLSGERVNAEQYNKEMEQNLLEVIHEKEQADKFLLSMEIFAGGVCLFTMLAFTLVASYVAMPEWLRITVLLIGMLPLLVATPFMLRIEQKAGYYVCAKCGHRYVPTYKSIFFAMHKGRTRYMTCPRCGEKSWQKKVLSKK